jgi:hypothetical protein
MIGLELIAVSLFTKLIVTDMLRMSKRWQFSGVIYRAVPNLGK